jgi:5-(carboxyamino)imidazole ribonucleotide mutase
MPSVGVIIGSKTDETLIQPALDMLKQLGIDYEFSILSAHRNPEKVRQYGSKASERGIEVIIAAAGAAAHLPGAVAGWTTLPVIGVPLPTSELKGLDSLYSIVQMPAGVPVACVGIGAAGAKNAALLAAQILGIRHKDIKNAYEAYKIKQAET